jgi:hypothetical protein
MKEQDDIRPRGTVQVKCQFPGCRWEFWVDCLHPLLPEGPFLCEEHLEPGSIERPAIKCDCERCSNNLQHYGK